MIDYTMELDNNNHSVFLLYIAYRQQAVLLLRQYENT